MVEQVRTKHSGKGGRPSLDAVIQPAPGIARMETCRSVVRLNPIRGCEDREVISELGLRIVFGLRDAGGEPVMRSRRGDQKGRAITSAGRGRRQDVVDFNVTIGV